MDANSGKKQVGWFLFSVAITNIALLVVNIGAGAVNIILPSYVRNPELRIENARLIHDETEINLDRDTHSTIVEAIGRHQHSSPCLNMLIANEVGFECADEIKSYIDDYQDQFSSDLEYRVRQRNSLDDFETVSGSNRTDLTGLNILPDHSFVLTLAQAAKDEFRDAFIRSYIASERRDVDERIEELETYLSAFSRALESINSMTSARASAGGLVVAEIVVFNVGLSDALVHPVASITVNEAELTLTRIHNLSEAINPTDQDASNYAIVREKSFSRLLYKVDEKESSRSAIDRFRAAARSVNGIDAALSLEYGENRVTHQGYLPATIRSFEAVNHGVHGTIWNSSFHY